MGIIFIGRNIDAIILMQCLFLVASLAQQFLFSRKNGSFCEQCQLLPRISLQKTQNILKRLIL